MKEDFAFEDQLEEACGVFGVYSDQEQTRAAELIYIGLFSLQHRGQESAGMVVSDGQRVLAQKDVGLVSGVFNPDNLSKLKGRIGIGHVRQASSGSAGYVANAEPLMGRCSKGVLAVAHNGSLLNKTELRRELEERGALFQTSTGTEVIMNLIAGFSKETLEDAVALAASRLEGSFSLVIMTKDTLIGVRDPRGMRPLCLGRVGEALMLSSESCAFSVLGGEFIRDVEPGEVIIIDQNGLRSHFLENEKEKALCVFEYIYFARPDSTIDGLNVHQARKAMGRELAREFSYDADIVIPVPDTGVSAALGFSEVSGIPYEVGLIKNPYVGRTFIRPRQEQRSLGVRIKLNPVAELIKDRRIVIIDDTIVRGTTTGKIIHMLKETGAREIHLCISAPPVAKPCFYGIDTSNTKELIAADHSVEEIRKHVEADSLTYLSLEGLQKAIGRKSFCLACFTGEYPIKIPEGIA